MTATVSKLSGDETLSFLIIISIVLVSARVLGEIFRKMKMPAVLGELLAGILLGPTLLGTCFPQFFHFVFLSQPGAYKAFDGIANVGIIFLMFVAGMEVDLKMMRKHSRAATLVSISSLIFPFVTGFIAMWFFYDWLIPTHTEPRTIAAVFFGTALSITALSVIAKILMDTELIKSKVGNIVLTAAMINDFCGWILFSILIKLLNQSHGGFPILTTIITVVLFAILTLTIGKWIIHKVIRLANRNLKFPGGTITIAVCLCFLGAVFTEYLGIRGIFGAFLMGIAVGDSRQFHFGLKQILNEFITNIFAPFFFASVGLRVNFLTNFDWQVVSLILLCACFAKVAGAWIGSRLGRMNQSESMAVAFGMNARGSMELVLGLLALQAKIIDDKIFVGLVIMTMVTAMMAGPLMKYFLRNQSVVDVEENRSEEIAVAS
jgi:Kef-type K+ transport system membrane component KefB